MQFLIAIYLIWGGLFLAIERAIAHGIPPIYLSASACAVGGVLTVAMGMTRSQDSLVAWNAIQWRRQICYGFGFWTVSNGLLYYGAQFLPAGITAFFLGAPPFLGFVLHATKNPAARPFKKTAGAAIGFFGLLL